MENRELYARAHQVQWEEIRQFLAEYIHLIRWKKNGTGRAMDIGSGPGTTTVQILLPMLPDTVRELVATDMSPRMIQYARKHQQDPRVSFYVLDIATRNLSEAYYGRFDHVFSLYCLHWIRDQRQAMKNIFNMLQPGGDILLLYLSRNPAYEVLQKLASLEPWKPYMEAYTRNIAPYQFMENVDAAHYSLLHELGFVNIRCECKRKEYRFENMNVLTDAMAAINPYLPNLPEHLKERYREELSMEHKIQAFTKGYVNSDTGIVSLPYTTLMVNARKP